MKINQTTLAVLSQCRVEGNNLFLPEGQLERKVYQDVDKVLGLMGGKWNRKARAHVFDECPEDLLDSVVLTQEVRDHKKEFQFFPTPKAIAEEMVFMACLPANGSILEPSAGTGDIAEVVREKMPEGCSLKVVELNEKHRRILEEKGFNVGGIGDFLQVQGERYDRIIANPPFTRLQDVDHVNHMYSLLNPGGMLVSVMSVGWQFRQDKKCQAFRDFIDETNGVWKNLPEGAFKSSGTMVNTCIVAIQKAQKDGAK